MIDWVDLMEMNQLNKKKKVERERKGKEAGRV